MKNRSFKLVTCLLLVILFGFDALTQVPQKFNYQGIARDAKGRVLTFQPMTLKISLLITQDAAVAEYEEVHNIVTNEFGLYTLQIGNGKALTGDMKNIKWETGNIYIRVAIDPKGGNNYVNTGTSQLLTVPYAIYANQAGFANRTSESEHNHTRSGTVSTSAVGPGNANLLAKFTAANTIENSQVFDNGTNIGIGTTAPLFKVHIEKASGNSDVLVKALDATGAATLRLRNSGNAEFGMNKFGPNATGTFMGIPRANMAILNNSPTGPFVLSTGTDFTFGNTVGATQLPRMFIQGSNGDVGIGTINPVARLHVVDSAVVFNAIGDTNFATFNNAPPIQGAGRRMMWYPEKSSFRVGAVIGSDSLAWNKDSIGAYSFASGKNTKASGKHSTAMGSLNTASGESSTALGNNTRSAGEFTTTMGSNTLALGQSSIAMGNGSKATGQFSTAMGNFSHASGIESTAMGRGFASGQASTAMGSFTSAKGFSSTAMGEITKANGAASLVISRYNDSLVASQFTIQPTTPLFIVGNGTASSALSNAFVVRNDGNTEIQNEVQRPSKTGNANLLPICYGGVNGGGTIQGANNTGNYTIVKTTTGTYEITITGETYNFGLYTTLANALSASPRMVTTLANAGKLQIRVFDSNGLLVDDDFHFVVYKN